MDPLDIALPEGYRIEAVATGLTFPTGVMFDNTGRIYAVEAGYLYGEVFTTPRLLRVEAGGRTTVIATGKNSPWTGVTFANGAFYPISPWAAPRSRGGSCASRPAAL